MLFCKAISHCSKSFPSFEPNNKSSLTSPVKLVLLLEPTKNFVLLLSTFK